MHVKIHGNRDYVKGNKESCVDLAHYLEKENLDLEKDFVDRELFFNQNSNNINVNQVISKIDNNVKGLKKNEAKFFMLTVNPSQRELKHLAHIASRRDVKEISQLTPKELEKYNNLVKDYTRVVMDQYAKGFNRGLTGDDLLYYSKLEQTRHYRGFDKEVKDELVQQGDLKPGLQTHVHVIVSRKDINMKHSISPHANSRGSNNHKLNGKNVTVGMDRDLFVGKCENIFDKTYNYKRDFKNSYDYYKYEKQPSNYYMLAHQAAKRPEQAMKNVAIKGIEKLSKGAIPAQGISSIAGVIQNPESAKNLLISKLSSTINNLLPPHLRAAKVVTEKIAGTISRGISL